MIQIKWFSFVANRVERSSDQVIKPVNLEAMSKWVGNIPDDVVRDMADIAPMLSVLGYDPYANPPDYGKADSWVQENTFKVRTVGIFCCCKWLILIDKRAGESRPSDVGRPSE